MGRHDGALAVLPALTVGMTGRATISSTPCRRAYSVAHGAGFAVAIPAVLTYYLDVEVAAVPRLAQLARRVGR